MPSAVLRFAEAGADGLMAAPVGGAMLRQAPGGAMLAPPGGAMLAPAGLATVCRAVAAVGAERSSAAAAKALFPSSKALIDSSSEYSRVEAPRVLAALAEAEEACNGRPAGAATPVGEVTSKLPDEDIPPNQPRDSDPDCPRLAFLARASSGGRDDSRARDESLCRSSVEMLRRPLSPQGLASSAEPLSESAPANLGLWEACMLGRAGEK